MHTGVFKSFNNNDQCDYMDVFFSKADQKTLISTFLFWGDCGAVRVSQRFWSIYHPETPLRTRGGGNQSIKQTSGEPPGGEVKFGTHVPPPGSFKSGKKINADPPPPSQTFKNIDSEHYPPHGREKMYLNEQNSASCFCCLPPSLFLKFRVKDKDSILK